MHTSTNTLYNWLETRNLQLSFEKLTITVLTPWTKEVLTPVNVIIDGHQLQNMMGVTFDQMLNLVSFFGWQIGKCETKYFHHIARNGNFAIFRKLELKKQNDCRFILSGNVSSTVAHK